MIDKTASTWSGKFSNRIRTRSSPPSMLNLCRFSPSHQPRMITAAHLPEEIFYPERTKIEIEALLPKNLATPLEL